MNDSVLGEKGKNRDILLLLEFETVDSFDGHPIKPGKSTNEAWKMKEILELNKSD